MYCPCGQQKILAQGLCATCYTLKRQDEEYFGGFREAVLERDGYCCRSLGRDKRSIAVHHRVRGKSLFPLMISSPWRAEMAGAGTLPCSPCRNPDAVSRKSVKSVTIPKQT